MRIVDADALIKWINESRCADCPDKQEDRCAACQWDDVIMSIETAPTVGGWISVKDRLPENDREVITAYKIDDEKAMKKRKGKLYVKTGNWTGERWISVWDEYKSYATEEEVLYWMSLPEPPEEVSGDETGSAK